jgi:hypothetical protein
MNKTSIFWMSAAMALSDVVMLRCTAGTSAALIYALLAGSAMVIMVQAATAHLEQV